MPPMPGAGLSPDAFLRDLFDAALAAADPFKALPPYLPERPSGRVVVVGAGKASARMAQAVEAEWGPCEGLVIVPHGASLPTEGIELVEARHPVPDEAGHNAAHRILALLGDLDEEDMALCLISGGGSALMSAPLNGISLEDKQAVNKALLASGAAIDEMNVVRKHLSQIKGGRLAVAAYPARVVTLTISDVPGDDPSIIASGPTVPDHSTAADARAIIARLGTELPASVNIALQSEAAETPDPSHPVFAQAETHLISRPQDALEAAAARANELGITPLILGDAIEGEAREVGKTMAGIALQVLRHGQPAPRPCVLISGGETTVTVTGKPGKGGRCSEFLLGYALGSWGEEGLSAIACDTDGRDGSERNAGAIWTAEQQARADSSIARHHLAAHDAYSFFKGVGGLVETGPTHTNVNDFRAILVI